MRRRRYFHALKLFIGTAVSAELEYRANFIIATLNSIFNLSGSLFGLFLFYRTGHRLGGWQWDEALLVMGLFTFLEGVSATWLSPDLNRIVRHVQQGTLDFVLLKPLDSQFWISTRYCSIWGLPNVFFGLGITAYAGIHIGLGPRAYAAGLFPLLLGVAILYSLWFSLAATSVWFVKIHNVTNVLRSLLEAGRYPSVAYPVAFKFFFTFIIPVAFLTTVPAQAMLHRTTFGTMSLAVVLALSLFILARSFWRFSLRFYTSASS